MSVVAGCLKPELFNSKIVLINTKHETSLQFVSIFQLNEGRIIIHFIAVAKRPNLFKPVLNACHLALSQVKQMTRYTEQISITNEIIHIDSVRVNSTNKNRKDK